MSTTSAELGLTIAETTDVVDVDAHIAANFQTLDSKWSTAGAPAAVEVGSGGSPGASTVVSRSDHVHGITTGTPVSTGTANSAGANTTVAASDHVHKTGDNSVATATIQDNAVTTAKILNANVTADKLATNAVTDDKITDLHVTTAKINTSAVTTAKIADLNVTTAKINTAAVTIAKIDSIDSPANDEVFTYDGATGRGEWQSVSALVTVGATVPSGLIAAFATAAAIASGWARYTTADGRMLVGAGTTFTVTFTENTAYGSSWSHSHTTPAHNHSGAPLTFSGETSNENGPSGGDVVVESGSGENVADDNHTHSFSGSIAGNTATDGSGTAGSTAWAIPSHAVVWAQKS